MRAPVPAVLVLEDGRAFRGEAFGAGSGEVPGDDAATAFGEAVFCTAMTGYQETLTDPSFHRQVVVMTAPHVGNTGWVPQDDESRRLWPTGFVVRDPSRVASSWRADGALGPRLARARVVGVGGVDTRALTRHLRDRGAMRSVVATGDAAGDVDALVAAAAASPGMQGQDLSAEVTTPAPYVVPASGERRARVLALDYGIKRSVPRYLASRGIETHVRPCTTTAEEVVAEQPDGVFLSPGPGDPATADAAVETVRRLLASSTVPVFGICFGNQLLGRALGLPTYKLVFGHRGVNQPVREGASGRVAITSHNHGFAVGPPEGTAPHAPFDTAAGRARVTHTDLNDGVVEGLECLDVRAFSAQYHPEAAPGPHDATGLFDRFLRLMEA